MIAATNAPAHRRSLMIIVFISVIATFVISSLITQATGFHLSFGHRLLRSATNPQLNPPNTLIRPIECRNANNYSEVGICMFSIDCMQNKGVPLSVCKHNYFVGTCCKLPDYNNFVGIVYDLRDTEHTIEGANNRQQAIVAGLEARKSQATSSAPQTTLPALPSTSAVPHDSIGDRYMISATSLFPKTSSAAPHLTQVDLQPPETQDSVQRPAQAALGVGESARHADASVAVATEAASQASLLNASTQIIDFAPAAPPAHSQSKYEVVREDAGEQVNTVNSAHSAPKKQHQFVQSQPAISDATSSITADTTPAAVTSTSLSTTTSPTTTTTAASTANDLASTQSRDVYLIDGFAKPAHSRVQPSLIIADALVGAPDNASLEHAQPQAATAAKLTASKEQPGGDQEFTLSSVPAQSIAESASSSADTTQSSSTEQQQTTIIGSSPATDLTTKLQSSTTASAATTSAPTTTTSTGAPVAATTRSDIASTFVEVQQMSLATRATASPFVDLVSSSQSTTPFTTSLSTALLPNISSHPYAPTTPSPVSVDNNSTATASQTLVPQTRNTSTTRRPVGSSLVNALSQLYNGAQQQQQQHLPDEPVVSNSNHRPAAQSFGPQQIALVPTTKIVSASSPPSMANNLIPGLSGLQSAILSHIPFKIASGLSSGLSNYLQAAMKPTASKPLLSSNTAPASHYQLPSQQHFVIQNNLTSKPSGVRFPGTDSLVPMTTLSPLDQTTAGAAAARDMVREAQLVCGRPQVGPHSSTATSTTSARSDPLAALLSTTLAPSAKRRVARIVGGNQSLFGQWPWMVSLRQWRKGAFLHKCGAALLNENWAITAAHCVENVKASDLLLRLGEFDVSNQEEPYPFVERRVKTVVSHPQFDSKTFEYDLALMRFVEPVKYERNIVPVCVPAGNDSYVDRVATVIGWGRLYEDGPLPDVIQHVDVPIITNNECEKMYKNAGYIEEIPDMFICAGISKGGRDSCEGDSGGPLTMVDHDGRSYLVGIISWGIGCALPSQPGVYTRITAFSSWINQITMQ